MTDPLESTAPAAVPAAVPAARPPVPVEAPAAARRAGLVLGVLGVLALAGALAVYLAGGRPYDVNAPAVLLYLGGLGLALTASVLLWMAGGEPDGRRSPGRRRLGVATAGGALLLTCVCAVVSVGQVAGMAAQLALMGVTAAVLAAAVVVARP